MSTTDKYLAEEPRYLWYCGTKKYRKGDGTGTVEKWCRGNTVVPRNTTLKQLMPLPNAYPSVLLVCAQISDIHMSVFYDKQRVSDLRKFCEETLIEVIAPEVVLVTGKSAFPVFS